MSNDEDTMTADNFMDMLKVEHKTAFFRETGIVQTEVMNEALKQDYPFEAVYDSLHPIIAGFLRAGINPRSIATTTIALGFDIVTTAMALTDYSGEVTYDKDMEGFIQMMMTLINSMPVATTMNKKLLIAEKSIFNDTRHDS